MTSSKKKKKRIYNPITGKYYELRQRTTKSGRAGQLKGCGILPKRKRRNLYGMSYSADWC